MRMHAVDPRFGNLIFYVNGSVPSKSITNFTNSNLNGASQNGLHNIARPRDQTPMMAIRHWTSECIFLFVHTITQNGCECAPYHDGSYPELCIPSCHFRNCAYLPTRRTPHSYRSCHSHWPGSGVAKMLLETAIAIRLSTFTFTFQTSFWSFRFWIRNLPFRLWRRAAFDCYICTYIRD